jgi:hypothetical protein
MLEKLNEKTIPPDLGSAESGEPPPHKPPIGSGLYAVKASKDTVYGRERAGGADKPRNMVSCHVHVSPRALFLGLRSEASILAFLGIKDNTLLVLPPARMVEK